MLSRLERRLSRLTDGRFLLLCCILAVTKVGISPIGKQWVQWVFDAARSFPGATSYVSYSLVPVFIAKAFGGHSVFAWYAFWLTVLIAWNYWVFHRLRRTFEGWHRLAWLGYIASPPFTLQCTMIGHYDAISAT